MKNKNRRNKNILNKKNKTLSEPLKFEWLTKAKEKSIQLKNQAMQLDFKKHLTGLSQNKPVLFATPVLLVLVISYFAISTSDQDETQILVDSKPLSIPGNEIAKPFESVVSNKNGDAMTVVVEDPNAPLVEEEANVPLIEKQLLSTTVSERSDEDDENEINSLVSIDDNDVSIEPFAETPESEEDVDSQQQVAKVNTVKESVKPTQLNDSKQQTNTKSKAVKSWVFKKNPDQYTVLLMGGSNKKDILKFIDNNRQLERLSYYHTVKNNKSYYVVVQSTHDNYSDARKALQRLPKHIAKNKPWIRKYGSIQKEISANAEKISLLSSSFAGVD